MTLSRRSFIKLGALAPGVCIAPLGSPAFAALFENQVFEPRGWQDADGTIRYRADGIAKVTGQKVFARDIRAWDMPHWPARQSHAFLLIATKIDRVYEGIDLSMLDADLKPDRVVTAKELHHAHLALPDSYPYGGPVLLPAGKVPAYYGYPVAIVIYDDFARFRLAKSKLQFNAQVIRYGKPGRAPAQDPYAAFRIVRVAGANDAAPDRFSALNDDYVMPLSFNGNTPVWPKADEHGDAGQRGVHYAAMVTDAVAQPTPDQIVFEREYYSQYIDAAALEPNNCNCWYDHRQHQLHMVLATQSPRAEAEGVERMLKASTLHVERLFIHPAHTVGYGSKETDVFPFYGALAALFSPGRPVRLALDRYEQFQIGLKRHPVRAHVRLALDRRTLKMTALQSHLELNGGGRCLWTPIITLAAAGAATSIYDIPNVDVVALGVATPAPAASAMRGVGGIEAEPSVEMLVDEIAAELRVDPIDLRLANALRTGQRTITGDVPVVHSRLVEVLTRARAHPLWRGYGNFAEAGYAAVTLAADGSIRLKHFVVEIGTGASTTQALVCADWLGKPADTIEMGAMDWDELEMRATQDPYMISVTDQTRSAQDPKWTPSAAATASATNSAYYCSHYTREAARVIFTHGIAVAAARLWQIDVERARGAKWTKGRLTLAGLPPLTLSRLAAEVYKQKLVSAAVVHGFDRWSWAQADFTIDGSTERLPLDGLAIRRGDATWQRIERHNIHYPPPAASRGTWTRYSSLATLVAVRVQPSSGEVKVLAHHSVLDCGRMLMPELVSGQVQGGAAMGLGHALYEDLPLYEGGPGGGDWNFARYHVPLADEVAVWTQTAEVLPALADENVAKGIAEMTMVTPVPATANAVAHAIGVRIRELPVTPEKIRKALS
jgi:CO/xanthine dehydrogenase Mo-binding subunit